jgi:diguanylate cyclase (GGDEF)-like protein
MRAAMTRSGVTPATLRRLLSAIGIALAVIAALAIPAGYLFVGYSYTISNLEFRADLNAASAARYIQAHERLWQFQYVRLAELIELNRTPGAPVRHRIFDAAGHMVLEDSDHVVTAPVARVTRPIIVSGRTVGRVEAEGSVRPLLTSGALVAALSLLLAFGIYLAMRIFPVRFLDHTLGKLERTNRQFDAALSNMAQGLCMFDARQRLVVVNQPFSTLFTVPHDKFTVGMTATEFIDLIVRERSLSPARAAELHAQQKMMVERGKRHNYAFDTMDGRRISVVHTPMSNGGWITTYLDVTARHKAEAKVAHMAQHDALTELPNRRCFREQLQHELAHARAGFAVLCLDLDSFKGVNDTLGHPIGDQLLQIVARRLRGTVRDGDMVARLGGDEFAIVLSRMDQPEDAAALASRLIDVVSAPYDVEGHQMVIGLSVGVAIAPSDGIDADVLIKNADLALYRAKEEGRGTFRFFEQAMDARAQARRTVELDMRAGIRNGEFELHYQPIIEVDSGEITAFEALARWRHPQRGMIPPGDFIPVAEATGLIVPLGEWILRQACGDAATWSRPVRVAVNLSPVQFKHRTLVNSVVSAVTASGLSPGRLELEITESVLLHDSEATLATLHTLRRFGVRISMDDFGTGYSSLSYLRSFPFDKIKIDQSFVREMSTRDDCIAIVRAVTGLGKSLGITTTAEGVETSEQLALLRTENCREVQGYLFSKPRPASEVEAMLGQIAPARAVA